MSAETLGGLGPEGAPTVNLRQASPPHTLFPGEWEKQGGPTPAKQQGLPAAWQGQQCRHSGPTWTPHLVLSHPTHRRAVGQVLCYREGPSTTQRGHSGRRAGCPQEQLLRSAWEKVPRRPLFALETCKAQPGPQEAAPQQTWADKPTLLPRDLGDGHRCQLPRISDIKRPTGVRECE